MKGSAPVYKLLLSNQLFHLLEEKVSEKNFILSRDGAEKSIRKGWDEKASRALPHYGTMLPSSLASNAMHLHP